MDVERLNLKPLAIKLAIHRLFQRNYIGNDGDARYQVVVLPSCKGLQSFQIHRHRIWLNIASMPVCV